MHSPRPALADSLSRAALLAAAALLALPLIASAAQAAAPPPFFQSPEDEAPGQSAGRMSFPAGVAADPDLPGHLYVVDRSNARIDEFTAWGEFVKAWGWEVDKADPQPELQTCTAVCQKGSEGAGQGQFEDPEAIAVDSVGDVYVIEASNHRVQKFDPNGGPGEAAEFLLSFGESGAGQLEGASFAYNNKLAIAPNAGGHVFVAEGEKIKVFDQSGALIEAIEGGDLAGLDVSSLAAGPGGDLYATFNVHGTFEGEPEAHRLKPSGPSGEFLGAGFAPEGGEDNPGRVAVDGEGDVYVTFSTPAGFGNRLVRVQKYDPEAHCLTCGKEGEGGVGGFDRVETDSGHGPDIRSISAGGACGSQVLYAGHFAPVAPGKSFIHAYGEPPDTGLCPQPEAPPRIVAQYATDAETHSAEIAARINPRFWPDTTYRLEYGTAPCRSGGCTASTGERTLTSQVTSNPLPTEAFVLEGLAPATTYHYRFVAESGGGGPVYGLDPDGPEGPEEATPEAGLEGTFTTYRLQTPPAPCANDSYRGGPSATLPDCRAYELVSPLDKEGGDIHTLPTEPNFLPAVLQESSIDGGRLAYGTYRAFGDSQSAAWNSQYLATRIPGSEWRSHGISPPRGKNYFNTPHQTRPEFKAFSPDLCTAWVASFAEIPLPEAGPQEDNPNLYRRSDEECGGPSYTPLNTTVVSTEIELQGLSADGQAAVFMANKALAPGGANGKSQLYGRRGEAERFLCVLPGGAKYSGECTAGRRAGAGTNNGQEGLMTGALSAAGDRVYWTAAVNAGGAPIYLRENPFGEGGECESAAAPCTRDVSKVAEAEEGTAASRFWAASEDGSKAIFETGETLYEYRRADESTHPIADELRGVMGQSADLSRVYLASREAKGGPNAEGKEATAGEPNLYLYEAGELRFIATLAEADVTPPVYSPVTAELPAHFARVSPDGGAAAFMSAAPLSGYDNTDRVSGKADTEVFLYRAQANGGKGALLCVSCNPSGARPAGENAEFAGVVFQAAARLNPPGSFLYASRMLSDDGKRLFFESYDPLVLTDANGKRDVYQWEAAGEGTCEASSPSYSPPNGGCIDLISSGKGSDDAGFVDASPSGNDVFFTTGAALLPQDYGLVDIYDARSEGGLPVPPGRRSACEAETCQSPASPPAFHSPSSEGYEGPGDLQPATASRCSASARRAKRFAAKAKKLRRGSKHMAKRSPRRAKALHRKAARYAKAARRQSKSARRCRARIRKNGRNGR